MHAENEPMMVKDLDWKPKRFEA